MKKPVIGVLASTFMTAGNGYGGHERLYVNSHDIDAIRRNGGTAIAIPASVMVDDPEVAVSMCDGILFPGGEDIHPSYYGEDPIPELGATREEIDEGWMAVGKIAIEKKIPMFGTCKGLQVLNVLYGGSLYQDVYAQREHSIGHRQKVGKDYTYHTVDIEEGTYMASILGAGVHNVNSMHHQAVKVPGKGVIVSAVAKADGTVEAIESEDGLMVAVQWHPECLLDSVPEMNKLYRDFVNRCGKE